MSQALESKRAPEVAKDPQRSRPVADTQPAIRSESLALETLLYLQKFAGNAAVAEMLDLASERKKPESPTGTSPQPATPTSAPAANGHLPPGGQSPSRLGDRAPGSEVHGQPIEPALATALPFTGAIASPIAGALGSIVGSVAPPAPTKAPAAATPAVAAAPGTPKTPAIAPPQGAVAADSKAAGEGAAGLGVAATAGAPPIAEAAAAAPAPAPRKPETDPNFQAVKARVHASAAKTKQHPPAHTKVAEAHAAAQGPANEVASQAGAAQVDKMSGQQPGDFDKAAFMAAVRQAIAAAAPQNLEEADNFKDSGKAAQVGQQVSGLVGQNKDAAAQGIKGATEAPPDTSAAQPKPVTPMPAEQPGAPPPSVGAASAMPPPRSAQETSLAQGPADINAAMHQNQITEQQLKESNEPEFQGALDAKGAAEKHSAEAPKAFGHDEKAILDKAKGSAGGTADHGLQAMHADRAKGLAAVAGGKGTAKAQDEARRAEVSTKIEGLYNATKDEVTGILNGIDAKVDSAFKEGEEKARAAFESYVDTRMTTYKDDRYSGWTGGLKWAKDKLFGMPDEVNQFYVAGRDLYLKRMEDVISHVADIVGAELTHAKQRIAVGQQQIQEYVAGLPADLQKVGQEAQQNIQTKFDELTQAVDDKQNDLVNQLAQKYVESRNAVDDRIKEMKEANKGLVDKAKDAVMGVINTILKLKDMLLGVLAKAASVIGTIISAPIKFLGNLVDGVKQGLNNFLANIGAHLEKGLLGWLFGALADAGLQLPEKFDLKGILSIILQVLGLTYGHIRGLAVNIVGEEVVVHLEKTLEFFQILIKEGPAGLWKWIVDKLSEMKETVMTKIKDFIQEKVIIAGIMWLIGLLNPVAAFIKACKAIYDIVMFFIDRAQQVGEFVSSIVDSLGAIASGSLGEAAGKVEGALANSIPVIIGFLASLLGLGGISDKIRSIIEAIQHPIHDVITKVLTVVLKPFKWIGDKVKAGAAWAKKKVQQGVAFVKEKAKAGVAYVKGKVGGLIGGKDPDHDQKVAVGLAQIDKEEQQYLHAGAISKPDAQKVAAKVHRENPIFKSITVVPKDDRWDYAYTASEGVKAGPAQLTTSLKATIEAALKGPMTLASLKPEVEAASKEQRDQVWKDAHLMAELDAKLGRDDYLTFVTLLGEFQPSSGKLTESGTAHTSASEADQLVQKVLTDYVGQAVKGGRKIEGMVAVVGDEDWDRAGEAPTGFGKTAWQARWRKDINGFVDSKNRVWIHRNRGNPGTMIHEACHKYSTLDLHNLCPALNEGVTEWFTRKVYDTLKPEVERGNYERNYIAAKLLVRLVGEETVAKAYFDGDVSALQKAVEAKKKNWTALLAKARADEWPAAYAAIQ